MIDWFIGGATKYKKLVVNNRDLSQLVGTVAWSGDSKQVARKLVFTVASRASDRFLPKVPIREGDQVVFSYKDKNAPEKVLFGGPILDIDKGRFILSYNDCPQVRELYKGYTIERVERRENLSGNGENKKSYAEVIIRNY